MTDRDGADQRVEQKRVDPRYDAAFQRGFAGGVDRVRGDERAFARPGTGPVRPESMRPESMRESSRRGPSVAGLPQIAAVAETRRSRRAAPPELSGAGRAALGDDARSLAARGSQPAALPTGPDTPWEPLADVAADEPRPPAPAAENAPLLRNPWLLALLLAGLAGSALGLFVLYTGYSSPPASYYGDSDTPSPAWIQRQILYYASIPLLGCLPGSMLLTIAVAALRWRGRPAPSSDPADVDQTPDAPNSSPSR
ncbi:hypothetical protein SAMN06295885_0441 [Rathayibacter oskolensis]|uniref:Uncharacterized protein n=1 Tax=Rathayibacter oskolensis TaxID=1891671 RepID=A0A1X7N036_9MICO|nr:hypothetical protein [Rathayibacter oskolensis]SMH30552.1 hypothetical protein SAMN06295885_0441 [Rathayibacter oskolensis]